MTRLLGPLALYLELSLLLVVSYVLFRALRVTARRLPGRIDAGMASVLGRSLVPATLLAFVAAKLLLSLPPAARPVATGAAGSPVSAAGLADRLGGMSGLVSVPLLTEELGGSWLQRLDGWQLELFGTLLIVLFLNILAIGLVRTGSHVLELRRILRDSIVLRSIGRVRIVVSDAVTVPFSTSLFGKAHVVLPTVLLGEMSMLRIALRHELEHHRRRDPVWAIALELFRVFFFWHPVARAWVREISDLQELACDEALVRRGVPPREYGSCLLHVAEMAVSQRLVASAAMATASDRGALLRRRIDMLFHHHRIPSSRRWSIGLAAVSILLVVVAATASAAIWPGQEELDAALAPAPVAAPPAPAPQVAPVVSAPATAPAPVATPVLAAPTTAPKPPSPAVPSRAEKPAAPVAPPAPARFPDLEFTSKSGRPVNLSDLRGKVVLVDVWAAWCPHCQNEVSHLKTLRDELAGTDFEIVGLSFSRNEEEFEAFLNEREVDWPQRLELDGFKSEIGEALGVRAVPWHFLVDRNGNYEHVPRGDSNRLAERIVALLEGGNAAPAPTVAGLVH
jgi:thiol-disulfide isomerase/thioredoxin